MSGDDRVRFCTECGKEVHNFAAMTAEEAASLLETRGDDLCGRLTVSRDGTLETKRAPQPRGFRSGLRIRSLMKLIVWIARLLGLVRFMASSSVVTAGRVCVKPTAVPTVTAPATQGPYGADECDIEDLEP